MKSKGVKALILVPVTPDSVANLVQVIPFLIVEDDLEDFFKDGETVGFGKEAQGAGGHGGPDIGGFGGSRIHDDRDPLQLFAVLQLGQELPAVHNRHVYV